MAIVIDLGSHSLFFDFVQLSYTLWRYCIKVFWWIVILYSMFILACIYVFQFQNVLTRFRNSTGLSSDTYVYVHKTYTESSKPCVCNTFMSFYTCLLRIPVLLHLCFICCHVPPRFCYWFVLLEMVSHACLTD